MAMRDQITQYSFLTNHHIALARSYQQVCDNLIGEQQKLCDKYRAKSNLSVIKGGKI